MRASAAVIALAVSCLVTIAEVRAARADRPSELVDVRTVIPDAVIDMRYATADNFTGRVLYPRATCKLRRAVAQRLAKAAARLRVARRRLVIWDCYRPASIQRQLWKLVPDTRYVADPRQGSKHSRGAAIDVGLVASDGSPVVLPTAFDDFSSAAHRSRALAGPNGAEARRLARAMTMAGFIGMPTEWWHFDAADSAKYPLSDEPL
ncbi:MAG: M15 family metallopeptidase [Kofleriaceae bacterium]